MIQDTGLWLDKIKQTRKHAEYLKRLKMNFKHNHFDFIARLNTQLPHKVHLQTVEEIGFEIIRIPDPNNGFPLIGHDENGSLSFKFGVDSFVVYKNGQPMEIEPSDDKWPLASERIVGYEEIQATSNAFQYLDLNSLLCCRGVCKSWKFAIDSMPLTEKFDNLRLHSHILETIEKSLDLIKSLSNAGIPNILICNFITCNHVPKSAKHFIIPVINGTPLEYSLCIKLLNYYIAAYNCTSDFLLTDFKPRGRNYIVFPKYLDHRPRDRKISRKEIRNYSFYMENYLKKNDSSQNSDQNRIETMYYQKIGGRTRDLLEFGQIASIFDNIVI